MRARESLDQDANASVRQFQHPHDHCRGSDRIQVFGSRFFLVEILLRGEQNHPVLSQRFVDGPDRFFARDKQRHDHERIDHDVAQRQHR